MSAPHSLPAGLKPYRVSSAFGIIRNINGRNTPPHNGADWATPTGVPLEATIAGKVSLVGGSLTHVWGYYVHIICTCPKKHVVEYHILRDKPTFKIGDPIRLGQHIGYTGASGALNGKRYAPHHHHGTSENGRYFDPLTIGWSTAAGNASTPFEEPEEEEDDMYSEADRARDDKVAAQVAGMAQRVEQLHDGVFTTEPTSRGTRGGILFTLKAIDDAQFKNEPTTFGTPGGTLRTLKEILEQLKAK